MQNCRPTPRLDHPRPISSSVSAGLRVPSASKQAQRMRARPPAGVTTLRHDTTLGSATSTIEQAERSGYASARIRSLTESLQVLTLDLAIASEVPDPSTPDAPAGPL